MTPHIAMPVQLHPSLEDFLAGRLPEAAIIVGFVDDNHVDLCVFNRNGHTHPALNVAIERHGTLPEGHTGPFATERMHQFRKLIDEQDQGHRPGWKEADAPDPLEQTQPATGEAQNAGAGQPPAVGGIPGAVTPLV